MRKLRALLVTGLLAVIGGFGATPAQAYQHELNMWNHCRWYSYNNNLANVQGRFGPSGGTWQPVYGGTTRFSDSDLHGGIVYYSPGWADYQYFNCRIVGHDSHTYPTQIAPFVNASFRYIAPI